MPLFRRCALVPPVLLAALAGLFLASCSNEPNHEPAAAETPNATVETPNTASGAEPTVTESTPAPDATPNPTASGVNTTPTPASSSSTNAPPTSKPTDNTDPTVDPSTPTPEDDPTSSSPENSAPATTATDTSPEVPSAPPAAGACAVDANSLRITHLELDQDIIANEDEAALKPVVISPKPGGGSRVAFMGDDEQVHVVELDEEDQPTGVSAAFPAHDFSDLYADDSGGVLLLTRDAPGGGTLNCGEPTNLCGEPPEPAIPCFDMYLVRFDGESETWATQLTDSSASLPSYSTGKSGPEVVFIWWYAHHGRIAFDGERYASYFGAAISVSQDGCINIHQG